ncbi:hypothetical protein A7E77_00365 [Sphingomonas sp. NIC1]|nr:hypothetical protein A7E77_00365 [Sphingomonas sp. NIC1]
MGEVERKLRQDLYIRVCRDSGFQLDMYRAAALAGKIGGFHALDVWTAMPSLDVMAQIAAGTHPSARRTPTTKPRSAE